MRKWLITPLIVLLLALAFTLPIYASSPFNSAPGLEKAIAVQEAHTKQLLNIPGVVGTAVGLESGNAIVQILTERPGVPGLPSSLDGVPVTVKVTGKLVALDKPEGKPGGKPGGTIKVDPKGYFDTPVPIGVSSGSSRTIEINGVDYWYTGTLGARVINSDGQVFALSNNHVYAMINTGYTGDPIYQPGPVDWKGRKQPTQIGILYDYVPLDFDPNAQNNVDAAIASTTTDLVGNGTPANGYGIPSSIAATAELGMAVQKYGRTTSLTQGIVSGINADLDVTYDTGTAHFVNQIVIYGFNFSKAGDSGSLIVTDPGEKPVALLFAGSSMYTIGNPIGAVLDAFDDTGVLSIDGN